MPPDSKGLLYVLQSSILLMLVINGSGIYSARLTAGSAETLLPKEDPFAKTIIRTETGANSLQKREDTAYRRMNLQNEIVCKAVSINNIQEFHSAFGNCTVVEGSVILGPIHHVEGQDPFDFLSFPNLREITGYFLAYQVYSLRSFHKLFPNLSVIRGQTLLGDHSLIIFDNKDLEDLGFPSLRHIERGGVFIQKNVKLCYLETINWFPLVSKEYQSRISILNNKALESQCADQCPYGCSVFSNPLLNGAMRTACWNGQNCQKGADPKCDPTRDQKDCCNKWCKTGCYGVHRNQCLVCEVVHWNGTCYDKCPYNTYMLHGRRCLFEEECRAYQDVKDHKTRKYKAHNDSKSPVCVAQCPAGFMTDPVDEHRCVPCHGLCPKVCAGGKITSISSALQFKGCTIINGSLELQINTKLGTLWAKTLEESLSNIMEISDHLKVIRSHSLMSLGFLRRLEKIRGEELAVGEYAIQVIDNANLQDLFEFAGGRKSIRVVNPKAKVSFHFNPRLCMRTITDMVKHLRMGPEGDQKMVELMATDVSKNSNGDRVACELTKLNVTVIGTTSTEALLEFTQFDEGDHRQLLSYVIHYRVAPSRNLTKFEGRDACADNMWTQKDAQPPTFILPPMMDNMTHEERVNFVKGTLNKAVQKPNIPEYLHDLQPATQYALYITTYMIAGEGRGAESDIVYFETLSARPSRLERVRASSQSPDTINVYWDPPPKPNGVIKYYVIKWYRVRDTYHAAKLRNFCTNPIVDTSSRVTEAPGSSVTLAPGTCPCSNDSSSGQGSRGKSDQSTSDEEIEMENLVIDIAFPRPKERAKRSILMDSVNGETSVTAMFTTSSRSRATTTAYIDATTMAMSVGNTTMKPVNDTLTRENKTALVVKPTSPPLDKKITRVDGRTHSVTLTGLEHFSDYVIEVEACQDKSVDERPIDRHSPCSIEVKANPVQTSPKTGADNIPSDSVVVSTNGTDLQYIMVEWEDPPHPNGVILRVEIEYELVDGKQPKRVECFPRTQENETRHLLDFSTMHAGNYSFRLRASSFAGNGSWTQPKYIFIDPPRPFIETGWSAQTVVGIAFGILIPFLILAAIGAFYYRRLTKRPPMNPNVVSVNPDYYPYIPDEWEVNRDCIELGRELGAGSFGKVYEAIARNLVEGIDRALVAVKTINEDTSPYERNLFLQEASVMKSFRAHHVVKLLGVVSEGQPALVIMELMPNGDLRTWLRNQRADDDHPDRIPPAFSRVLQMAGEICDGMAYIHSKKFVHRDLAARNCMVSDDLTVKIGDFGMSRDIYETDYYRKGGKGMLPVRWMAPESLKDGLFTNASDVWSFGVVLWEIATLAAQPYQGLSNEDVLHHVIARGLMQKPEECPDRLYDLMLRCWAYNARDRPTFLQLVEELLPDLSEAFHELSYFSEVLRTNPALINAAQPTNRRTSSGPKIAEVTEMEDLSPKFLSPLTDPHAIHEELTKDNISEADPLMNAYQTDGASSSSQRSLNLPNGDATPVIQHHQRPNPGSTESSKSFQINFPPTVPTGSIEDNLTNVGMLKSKATIY